MGKNLKFWVIGGLNFGFQLEELIMACLSNDSSSYSHSPPSPIPSSSS